MSAKKRSGISPKIDPSILEPEIILKESKETLIIVEKPFDKNHGSHCFVLKVKYTSLRKFIRCNEKIYFPNLQLFPKIKKKGTTKCSKKLQ